MDLIDDATGDVLARFFPYEGTCPSHEDLPEVSGVPWQSIWTAMGPTSPRRHKRARRRFEGTRPMSQFERAMDELSVRDIHACSPQGKRRVERLFGTLQDRMIKEMHLEGIAPMEDDRFLLEFLPRYNTKFRGDSAQASDLHRDAPDSPSLDRIFCGKERRVVRKDQTISYEGQRYGIPALLPGSPISVKESASGELRFFDRLEHNFPCKNCPHPSPRKTPRPSEDHPWKKAFLPQKKTQNTYSLIGKESA